MAAQLAPGPHHTVHPGHRQEPGPLLQIGIAAFDGFRRREEPLSDRRHPARLLGSEGHRAAAEGEPAENAALRRQIRQSLQSIDAHGFQFQGTLYMKITLHKGQGRVGEDRQPRLFQLPRDPAPVRLLSEVENKGRQIQIHPRARAGATDMLGQMGQQIEEVELRGEFTAMALAHGVDPVVPEIAAAIQCLGNVRLQQFRVEFIIFQGLCVAVHRLPVGLDLIAQLLHEGVALRPVLGPDDHIDVAEGAKLRHGVVILQDVALHQHMVDAPPGKFPEEHVRQSRPLGIAADDRHALGPEGTPLRREKAVLHGHVGEHALHGMDVRQMPQLFQFHPRRAFGRFPTDIGAQQMEQIFRFFFHKGRLLGFLSFI